MTRDEFKDRTKKFASDIVRLVAESKPSFVGSPLLRQLLRAGTSVGSNYRAACRARSEAEMHSKLCIVEEEADEASFWLELLLEHGLADESQLRALMQESDEIVRMVVASKKRLKERIATQHVKEAAVSYESPWDEPLDEGGFDSYDQQSTIDNRRSETRARHSTLQT